MKSSAECLREIDAVILAGGLGTRLRSAVPDLPKCLAPINGKPYIAHFLSWLQGFGIRRVVFSLGYKAEMVRSFLDSSPFSGLHIETTIETIPLGTGGGVRSALPFIKSNTVLVANGDSFTKADLCQFIASHREKEADVSVLLTRAAKTSASGLVEFDSHGVVTSFLEKPVSMEAKAGFINAGIYLFERNKIADITPNINVSLERDILPKYCNQKFFAMSGDFPFIDIGTPESYSLADNFFQREAL